MTAQVLALLKADESELLSRSRHAPVVYSRQILMYVLWQKTGMTLAEIGEYLGGRTPATVSWGYQRIAEKLPNDKKLQKIVKRIGEKLDNPLLRPQRDNALPG